MVDEDDALLAKFKKLKEERKKARKDLRFGASFDDMSHIESLLVDRQKDILEIWLDIRVRNFEKADYEIGVILNKLDNLGISPKIQSLLIQRDHYGDFTTHFFESLNKFEKTVDLRRLTGLQKLMLDFGGSINVKLPVGVLQEVPYVPVICSIDNVKITPYQVYVKYNELDRINYFTLPLKNKMCLFFTSFDYVYLRKLSNTCMSKDIVSKLDLNDPVVSCTYLLAEYLQIKNPPSTFEIKISERLWKYGATHEGESICSAIISKISQKDIKDFLIRQYSQYILENSPYPTIRLMQNKLPLSVLTNICSFSSKSGFEERIQICINELVSCLKYGLLRWNKPHKEQVQDTIILMEKIFAESISNPIASSSICEKLILEEEASSLRSSLRLH